MKSLKILLTNKKIIFFLYLFFLAGATLYIRNIIQTDSVQLRDEEEEKIIVEVKPVSVNLSFQNQLYPLKLKNVDSAYDLILTLRKEGKLTYERTKYTYGYEIDKINGTSSTDIKHFRLFVDRIDITNEMEDVKLVDGKTYELLLVDR